MELSEELIAKAKGTKTPEELAALAKESSIDLTEEEAKAYFEQLATPAGSPHTAIHVSIVPTKKGCGSAITPLT